MSLNVHSLSHTHTHTHTLSHTHTHTRTLTHTHSLSHSHTHTLTHTMVMEGLSSTVMKSDLADVAAGFYLQFTFINTGNIYRHLHVWCIQRGFISVFWVLCVKTTCEVSKSESSEPCWVSLSLWVYRPPILLKTNTKASRSHYDSLSSLTGIHQN